MLGDRGEIQHVARLNSCTPKMDLLCDNFRERADSDEAARL